MDFRVVLLARWAEVPFAGVDPVPIERLVEHLPPTGLDRIELRGQIDFERCRGGFRLLHRQADDEIVDGRLSRCIFRDQAIAELDG